MRARPALAALLLSGLPVAAAAQESITYTLNWIEVVANTSTPVASPNGLVEPGEGARIRVSIEITPGVGSTATYSPPPGPGIGTIAGLAYLHFSIQQTNAMGGVWSHFRSRPGFAFGVAIGAHPDGSIPYIPVGQNALPGAHVNSMNPIPEIWQGTWTPEFYTPRPVSFQSAGAVPDPPDRHSAILIQYGPDPINNPQYAGKFVDALFGNTGPIPVVPAPSTAAALALAAVAAARRRR